MALLSVPSSPFHRGVKKGLDLQGGLEVVLKAEPPKGHKLTKADLDRSVNVMRNRVDKLGVASPEIREQSRRTRSSSSSPASTTPSRRRR